MPTPTLTTASLQSLTGLPVWFDDANLAHGVAMVLGVKDAHVTRALGILARSGVKAIARPSKGPAHLRDLGGCDVHPYTDAAGREAARLWRSR